MRETSRQNISAPAFSLPELMVLSMPARILRRPISFCRQVGRLLEGNQHRKLLSYIINASAIAPQIMPIGGLF